MLAALHVHVLAAHLVDVLANGGQVDVDGRVERARAHVLGLVEPVVLVGEVGAYLLVVDELRRDLVRLSLTHRVVAEALAHRLAHRLDVVGVERRLVQALGYACADERTLVAQQVALGRRAPVVAARRRVERVVGRARQARKARVNKDLLYFGRRRPRLVSQHGRWRFRNACGR